MMNSYRVFFDMLNMTTCSERIHGSAITPLCTQGSGQHQADSIDLCIFDIIMPVMDESRAAKTSGINKAFLKLG